MTRTNEQLALQIIYNSSSTTRSDLAKHLGLSQPTVTRLIGDLTEKGYVIEDSTNNTTSRGRPSNTLSINPDYGIVIGIELGRDKMILSFLSADGTLIQTTETTDVPDYHPATETMEAMLDVVFREAQKYNINREEIIAFGLAVHDLVSSNGEWITWQDKFDNPFPAQPYLESRLGIPVKVDDISRAFTFAESRLGGGRNQQDMIYLFVGRRGIGSGIFVNGKLLQSSSGICGEIGHIIVEGDGTLCQCGNHGCLETVATNDAIIKRVQKRIDEGVVTSLNMINNLSFKDICEAYIEGDKEAHIALSQLAIDLGKALTSTVSIVGSTHILIGGDLRNAGEAFLDDVERNLRRRLIPGLADRIAVRYAELPNYAGSLGVALQVLDIVWDVNDVLENVT